jgi:hypothetical protein
MTGCSGTQGEEVSAPRHQGEGLIKVGNPENLDQRDPELLGDDFHHVFREIPVCLLDVLKDFNELAGFSFSSLENPPETVSSHRILH